MHQDNDEPFRTLANRVRIKAETWNFTNVSESGKKNVTSYTEEAVAWILASVGDEDIRREVLSTEDIWPR